MRIEVVQGAEADAMLADVQVRAEWSRLHGDCPWATPMQSPDFALTWYTTYRAQFEPVLLTSRDTDGRLVGLLALAFSSNRGLVPAGAHQAEYQCWISTPEAGDAFPGAALRAVHARFPTLPLTFRYLPAEAPLGWLADAPGVARRSMLTPHDRPLMRFGDEAFIDKCFKRKNIKPRLNKLRRMGYAGIERITDVAEWEAVFDQVILYHDLRRVAVSGSAPFANDPLKKRFHLELMRRTDLLHVTVLKLGDQVVSAQLDVAGPREVHLALGAYAPWVSKHAAGKIHILELARMLMEGGCERIDLTPGNDSYKSDFANEWDTVHTLTCFRTRAARRTAIVFRAVERLGRRMLGRLKIEPARTKLLLGELRRRPLATLTTGLCAARRWAWSRRQTLVYARLARRAAGSAGCDAEPVVRRNAIHDLMAYRPRGLEAAVHAYLSQAGERFAQGMCAYTHAAGDELRYVAWITDAPANVLSDAACAALSLPASCAVVFDTRQFRSASADLPERAMHHIVREAERQTPAAAGGLAVLVLVPHDDLRQRRLVESMGFACVGAAVETLRFGHKHSTGVADPAAAQAAEQLMSSAPTPARPQLQPHELLSRQHKQRQTPTVLQSQES